MCCSVLQCVAVRVAGCVAVGGRGGSRCLYYLFSSRQGQGVCVLQCVVLCVAVCVVEYVAVRVAVRVAVGGRGGSRCLY